MIFDLPITAIQSIRTQSLPTNQILNDQNQKLG
jgi:hypothetical protein